MKISSLFAITLIALSLTTGARAEASEKVDYRAEMRQWIQAVSAYANQKNPAFIVVPHRGEELLTVTGKADGEPATGYIAAIDGQSFEGVFYGHSQLNIPTSSSERGRLLKFIEVATAGQLRPMVIDYCFTRQYVENSIAWNQSRNYLAFAADHIELNSIPPFPQDPPNVNKDDVADLAAAKNFLCLATARSFSDKASYVNSIAKTNYDLVILEPFYQKEPLTSDDLQALKKKANGGQRLVMAYLKVGLADHSLPYWQESWQPGAPSWLAEKSIGSVHDFYVQYWDPAWQQMIMGAESSLLDQILKTQYDGVFLDGVDVYKHFEREEAKPASGEAAEANPKQ